MTRPLAALAALALLAVPATASAATPANGQFRGDDGVGFYVRPSPHGTPLVDIVSYHGRTGFPRAYVKPKRGFHTCAVLSASRVVCLAGSFPAAGRATGTAKVFKRTNGRRAQRPSETHRWTAAH